MKYKIGKYIITSSSLVDAVNIYKNVLSVKDSDALKRLAYEFAQMGNYFDRANSAHSREILSREDTTKFAEFKRIALRVKQQLEKEVSAPKKTDDKWTNAYANETVKLLKDGVHTLHWRSFDLNDSVGKALADAIDKLITQYQKQIYWSRDSVDDSINDSTRQDVINQIKSVYIADGETWEYGDERKGWFVEIRSHHSTAFGKILYDGILQKSVGGPLNGVKIRMIEYLSSQMKDSVEDAENDDIEELSDEERQAIEDYKAAIANTTDPKLLRLFSHILKEEIEHLEELQSEEIGDSVEEFATSQRIQTPRGTFTVYKGEWKDFQKEDDEDDWGFWFDHYTDDDKHYKIMHNHINNHAIAVLKKD